MTFCLLAAVVLLSPVAAWASSDGGGHGLLSAIGISIIAATVLAYLAYLFKQPLLLAYIAAGAVIGPQFGFGWVQSKEDIRIIAEIGLILLLFMIGLELDLKKLKESGKSLITTGILQFLLCAAMGLGFFMLLGFTIGEPYEYQHLRRQGPGRRIRPALPGRVHGPEQHHHCGETAL